MRTLAGHGPPSSRVSRRGGSHRALVGVTLRLVSPDGDSSGAAGSPGCANGCTGYPAQLTVDVTFTLNNQGRYAIRYKAHNDDAKLSTVVNLTNHSYFNLAGVGPGQRPRTDRLDGPAGRPVLQRQLPQRHAHRHFR